MTKLTIADLNSRAPTSLEQARIILRSAVKAATKELGDAEKRFYGNKTPRDHLCGTARMVTKLMKQVNLNWLTEPMHMDSLSTRVMCQDDESNDLQPVLKNVKEVYEKTWKIVPAELEPVIEKIETILKFLKLYCPAVYNPATDPFIQMSEDYATNVKQWAKDIKQYMGHVMQIKEKFHRGALFLDEMSRNTREMAMKLEAEDCPFIFAFFEACECLREAIKIEQQWLIFADEYPKFLSSEMEELQKLRLHLQPQMLGQQDKYNKEHYRLTTLQQELDGHLAEQAALQSKEMELLVREEMLMSRVSEMKLDFDIKEFRLAEMQRTVNPKTAASAVLQAMHELADEVKIEGKELSEMNRELALIKIKMTRIIEKQEHCKKLIGQCEELSALVKTSGSTYRASRKNYGTKSHTIDHIRYMVQYLTTPDTAQKIFLGLPRRREALGVSKSHGLNISSEPDDLMDSVFELLSSTLGSRWIEVYRQLPFYPPRGDRTIEDDISHIQADCIRDSQSKEIIKALNRWRRFHTRAKPADLISVVSTVGEPGLMEAIDRIINPPRPPTPVEETFPPFLENKLIPYYQQVSRYDHLRRNKKTPATRV